MENEHDRGPRSFEFFHGGQRVIVFVACIILILAAFIPWSFTKHPVFIAGWLSTTLLYFWLLLATEVAFAIIISFAWLKKREKRKTNVKGGV